ncbi:enoyl-CoA delta isomerase 1, mitochondrial-like [Acanthaster planci]|uniref:Enoyl-CoA delta isomerase 1, mitochondrial n=1 Tax=Acanthaster planci TaxID=133434 RepID=A0A8B7YMN0_ACAPL|nr:enoyl-CoA delta isomerase 1, mitochondrial-like [Acanthaster planci]
MESTSRLSGISNGTQRHVTVEKDKVLKDVAVISLNRSPSNLLNRKLLRELIAIIDDIEANKSYRGAILTSSVTSVFSSGLDVVELHQKSFDQFRDFWSSLQDLWVRLYLSRLVTIAAINGTAVAGGCLLAMSCDYRIMAKGPYSIGLPENVIGLVNSVWVYEMFARLVGHRQAEMSLQLGTEYTLKEAAEIKLVDEVVHPKKLMEATREEMSKWLRIPDVSRVRTKQMIREPVVMTLQASPEGDTQSMYSYISQDVVQETLEGVLKKFKMLDASAKK